MSLARHAIGMHDELHRNLFRVIATGATFLPRSKIEICIPCIGMYYVPRNGHALVSSADFSLLPSYSKTREGSGDETSHAWVAQHSPQLLSSSSPLFLKKSIAMQTRL